MHQKAVPADSSPACALPANTSLDGDLIAGASFADSYRVALSHDASVIDIFFAVFGHHPAWMKAILVVRHRVGTWFGIEGAGAAEVMRSTRAASYRVGENIGPWPICFLGEEELVAGRDNKHLDFRVSVLKQRTDQGAYAVVSTVCRANNRFGRIYLLLVVPFHKWGVQRLLSAAARAGRL